MAEVRRPPTRIILLVMIVVALLLALGITAFLWRQDSREAAEAARGLAQRGPDAPGSATGGGAGTGTGAGAGMGAGGAGGAGGSADGRAAGSIQGGLPGAGMAGLPGGEAVLPGTRIAPETGVVTPGATGSALATGEAAAPPAPRFPVEAIRLREAPAPVDLPPIEQSDPVIADSLETVISPTAFAEFFYLDNIARRFVVTVDNLPRDTLAMRLRSAKPIPERFTVRGKGEVVELDADNYKRYERFVRFILGIDTRVLVALYVRYYPLLQQEYRSLGYPQGYFNDRVVEAVDDLLAAPPIGAPVDLVQPKVMYKYENPDLEGLSPGQKIMIRIGPANSDQLKAKLRAIRRELTGQR